MTTNHQTPVVRRLWRKWAVALKTAPVVLLFAALKLLAHQVTWEVMELNALLTSLVAGTIFLIGFLVSGVLMDYKEGERLPSDLAASLNTLVDDARSLRRSAAGDVLSPLVDRLRELVGLVIDWFYRRERTQALQERISRLSDHFAALDAAGVHPAYVTKMKGEQSALRKLVLRIHTIRDTQFVGTAYTIVEVMGLVVSGAMVLTKIEPFFTGLFFTAIVSFLIFYMLFLIQDLDNPFDYAAHGEGGTEIPLKPLHDLAATFDRMDTP